MTVIDLGDVTQDTRPPAVPLDHRRLVRAVLALLTLAGLVTLAGSARPRPATVRPLWTMALAEQEGFMLDENTAYLERAAGLTAYDLATGRVRWTAPTAAGVLDHFGARPFGGLLLAPVEPVRIIKSDPGGGYVYYTEFSRATAALDSATGHELWRTAGEISPVTITGDTALAVERDKAGHLIRIRRLRLPDGRVLWARPVPGATHIAVARDKIVTAGDKGEIHVYGYADGALRRTGRVPWPTGSAQSGQYTDLSEAGQYFTVVQHRVDLNLATVYRPDDLRPLWNADASWGFVQACGPLLCTFSRGGVVGRDPASGRVVWQQPGMAGVQVLTGNRLLLDNANAYAPGSDVVLVDPGTGRQIGAPIRGMPVASALSYPSSLPHPSMLILRPTTRSEKVAVVRLDIATGATTLLGAIQRPGERPCRSAGRYLACPREGALTITAVG
jgi:outer membrane protein assembly factor BamB